MDSVFKQGKLFLGLNYWASNSSINMWHDWDEEAIDKDLKQMAESGISVLRVFPLWSDFQPLTAVYINNGSVYEYRFGEDPLPDTEAGRAGVSEEACQKFEKFCELANKYNLKLIVALITGHMSFRFYSPPAFEGKNFLSDPTTIKWEIRFVKYFVKRFKEQACIVAWDLGNEVSCQALKPGFNPDAAYLWTSAICDAIKVSDPSRDVITGLACSPIEFGPFNLFDIGEQVDLQTVHPYNIFSTSSDPIVSMRPILDPSFSCRLYEDIAKKPTFIQEVGSIGYMNCSEKSEADFYRGMVFSSWADNCGGVMWWCAYDQGHFDYAPYDWNNIGSDYGFYKKDRTEKPIANQNRELLNVINSLPFEELPKKTLDAVCLIPKGENANTIHTLRSTYCLAKQANIDVSFVSVKQPIPKAKLYIMPSIENNQAYTKRCYDKLMEYVNDGAVLYMSYGSALVRKFPETSGLTMHSREAMLKDVKLSMGDNLLPLVKMNDAYSYNVEECDAEVIGTVDSNPFFVKKQHGKGYIYTLMYPLEKMLSKSTGAFHFDDTPRYDSIYREINRDLTERVVDTDSKYIRPTEHIIDDNNRYIVAINYSSKQKTAKLILKHGWQVCETYYNNCENGLIELQQGDALIMKVTKKS